MALCTGGRPVEGVGWPLRPVNCDGWQGDVDMAQHRWSGPLAEHPPIPELLRYRAVPSAWPQVMALCQGARVKLTYEGQTFTMLWMGAHVENEFTIERSDDKGEEPPEGGWPPHGDMREKLKVRSRSLWSPSESFRSFRPSEPFSSLPNPSHPSSPNLSPSDPSDPSRPPPQGNLHLEIVEGLGNRGKRTNAVAKRAGFVENK